MIDQQGATESSLGVLDRELPAAHRGDWVELVDGFADSPLTELLWADSRGG